MAYNSTTTSKGESSCILHRIVLGLELLDQLVQALREDFSHLPATVQGDDLHGDSGGTSDGCKGSWSYMQV